MARFTASFAVEASVDAAFAFLRDPRNRAAWDSSVRDVTPLDEATGEVGDRYAVTIGFYGKGIDATTEVVELVEPGRIVFATSGKATGRDVIEIAEAGAETVVSLDLRVTLKGAARLLDRGLQVAFSGIGENAVAGVTRSLSGDRPTR